MLEGRGLSKGFEEGLRLGAEVGLSRVSPAHGATARTLVGRGGTPVPALEAGVGTRGRT